MRNRASLTAECMALFRAIESARPASSRLFCDPFAALFLHRWRKWMYGIARCDAGRRLVELLFDRELPGARAAGIARTKWIDDEVTRSLETSQPKLYFGAEKLLSRLHALGEPWTFGLYPKEIERYLAARRLRLVRDLSAAEVWQRAGRTGSNVRGYEFYRLASACVPAYTESIP